MTYRYFVLDSTFSLLFFIFWSDVYFCDLTQYDYFCHDALKYYERPHLQSLSAFGTYRFYKTARPLQPIHPSRHKNKAIHISCKGSGGDRTSRFHPLLRCLQCHRTHMSSRVRVLIFLSFDKPIEISPPNSDLCILIEIFQSEYVIWDLERNTKSRRLRNWKTICMRLLRHKTLFL